LSGDAPLQNLLLQVDEIKKRIEQLSTKYTPAHPAMMEAQKKLDELQATVAAQRADDLQRFRLDYETAKQAEDRLRASQRALAQPPPQGPALSTLQREVAAKRQNYDRLVEKTKQVQSPLPGQASVVDQAVAPPIPYRPDPVGTLAFGAFGGLLLGLAGVVLRERLDRTIRAPGEAVTYSGSAELGFIPAMKVRGNAPGFTVELAVWQQKMSLTSAAFSAAATSLLFSFDGDSPLAPLVVLTSVAPMEGKTTSACNLAVAAAEARRRVLLIDGDLIKPRLHTVFNLTNDFGLSNLLASEDPLDETALSAATQPSGFPGLDVLPNGNHEASMTELLHSPRLTELFHLARARYQVVLVDAPPMPQIPIARVMGKMGDGVILVVRAGKTHREMLQRAAGTLRDDGIHIIGTLLNGWDMYGRGGYGYEAYTETYKRYGAGAR
jgi:capsular exopolysaccharide synthesis family protein